MRIKILYTHYFRGMRKPKIIIYGLFPPVLESSESGVREQLSEYPEWIGKYLGLATDLIVSLYNYIHLIKLEFVSFDTLRGLYYAIKYRLGNEPAIIVDGRVFKYGESNISSIKKYILDILRFRSLI